MSIKNFFGWCSAFVVLALLPVDCSKAFGELILVEQGRSAATIIIDNSASEQAKHAARELQIYLKKISGATVPISTNENVSGTKILVGHSKAVEAIKLSIPRGKTYQLNEEGYAIYCKDNLLVLAGNETPPYEGTFYAVYDFLESLGCRWYMPGSFGEVIPHKKTIVAAEVNKVVHPVFRIRDAWPDGYIGFKDEKQIKRTIDVWKRRNRFSNHIMFINPREKVTPFLHFPVDNSLKDLVPCKKYGKKHPEYYIKRGSGIDSDIPDISNPKIVRIAANTIRKFFREHPKAISYSFSGPDSGMWSNDANWVNFAHAGYNGEGFGRLYGGLDGANWKSDVSDLYFGYFVDELSRALQKLHQKKWLVTLAYSNRQRPPECIDKQWDNVIITVAPLQADPLRSFTDKRSRINSRYESYFRRWSEISAGIIYYAYDPRDYTMIMRPCWQSGVIRSNLRMLKKLNAWGFSIETVIGWMMNGLNHYIYGKLAWDIDTDTNAVIHDFCETFFLPASEPMEKYYRFVEKSLMDAPCVPFWAGPDDPVIWEIFNPSMREQCRKYLHQAKKLAAQEPYKHRVFVFRQHFRRIDAFPRMLDAMNKAQFETARQCYNEMADTAKKIDNRMLLAHKGRFGSLPERYFKLTKDLQSRVDGTKGELVRLLPAKGYFRIDPAVEGLTFGWQRQEHFSEKWKQIRLDTTWGAQGYHDELGRSYHGIAWYSIPVELSAEQIEGQLHLCIPSLYRDNCELWVWVNGKLAGYAKTKYVKATDIPLQNLNAGDNHITIRLFSAGGICIRPFIYRKGKRL